MRAHDKDISSVARGRDALCGQLLRLPISQHYAIGVAYEMGMSKIMEGGKSKNTNFMINLGYKF